MLVHQKVCVLLGCFLYEKGMSILGFCYAFYDDGWRTSSEIYPLQTMYWGLLHTALMFYFIAMAPWRHGAENFGDHDPRKIVRCPIPSSGFSMFLPESNGSILTEFVYHVVYVDPQWSSTNRSIEQTLHPIPGDGRGGAGPFNGPQVFMGHMGFDEEDGTTKRRTPENSARENVERCRNDQRKF